MKPQWIAPQVTHSVKGETAGCIGLRLTLPKHHLTTFFNNSFVTLTGGFDSEDCYTCMLYY